MSMRVKTWKIIDYGDVPETASTIEFTCVKCGREAMLPVTGCAIAQSGSALIFDIGDYAMPRTIQCRKCGRVFTTNREDK